MTWTHPAQDGSVHPARTGGPDRFPRAHLGHSEVMNSALGLLTRGALAGAAGTTALNAVSYADIALRARPSSGAPEQTVSELAGKVGVEIPGDAAERQNRLVGLGALTGITVGVGVGVVVAAATAAGARPPWWAQAAFAGALAMAAADVPLAALGISDPRTWSATDWASDVVPHVAYGLATAATLPAT